MYINICLRHIGANCPVQLSSRSHFANIENKKVIAENQCEKNNNKKTLESNYHIRQSRYAPLVIYPERKMIYVNRDFRYISIEIFFFLKLCCVMCSIVSIRALLDHRSNSPINNAKPEQKLVQSMIVINPENIVGPRRQKTCLRRFANNTGAKQPAHPRSLISAFVVRLLERSIR